MLMKHHCKRGTPGRGTQALPRRYLLSKCNTL